MVVFFNKPSSNVNQLRSLRKQSVLIELQKLKSIISVYLTVIRSLLCTEYSELEKK